MIEKLRIRNFQKHGDLLVKFDERITTIVGPSDAGKSAILRALRWVLLNQPDGDAFIRDGQKEVSVVLRVDGHTVKRRRGKANEYVLDKKSLVSFGRGNVPDLVARITNVSDENFQLQHEAPFWFDLSAGEVSKRLNAIVDLQVVDESLAAASKMARERAAQAKIMQKAVQDSKNAKKRLAYVPTLVEEFERLTEAHEVAVIAAQSVSKLSDVISCAKTESARHRRYKNATRDSSNLAKELDSLNELNKRTRRLADLLEGVLDHNTTIEQNNTAKPLAKAIRNLQRTASTRQAVGELVRKLKTAQQKQWQAEKEKQELESRLPKRCPTCSRVMVQKT